MDFEQSLLRLEEITQKLESGELSLDESLKIFEEGIKLSRLCEKKLTDADQKLEILKSTDFEQISNIDEKENLSLDDAQVIKQENIRKKKKSGNKVKDDKNDIEKFLF